MILDSDLNDLTIKDMKEWLKSMSMTHSYKSKQQYIDQLTKLQKYYNFPWRKDQRQILQQFLNTDVQYYIIQGLWGAGKCFELDTPIMMYNGTTRRVQDIQVGDKVMGDDSTPRTVMSLGRGQDYMYSITNTKGESYTVNSEHILCLKYSKEKTLIDNPGDNIWIVSWFDSLECPVVSKFFVYNTHNKESVYAKAFSFFEGIHENLYVNVEVKDYIKLPPELKENLLGYRVPLSFPEKSVSCDPYDVGSLLAKEQSDCIPSVYKFNSRKNRLKLLEGLTESSQKLVHKKLATDIQFVARSLGFSATVQEEDGLYQVLVSKTEPLESKVTVKKEYYGNYYGFTLDGNHKFLLENFTVTHNTSLLIGMLLNACWQQRYKPEEIMFVSFNVSIRNEIKQKLRNYGLKQRVTVRTFDSIVWEICKKNNYRYIDLPNFDGKRRFVYDLIQQKKHTDLFQPRCIFIDEVQDLEQQTWEFFQWYYKDSTIVLAGDIFQSIQKEPRESLLWHLLHNTPDSVRKNYMYQTPRVPQPVLKEIKTTLRDYYPEFIPEINRWESLNPTNTNIQWKQFYNYQDLFNKTHEHLQEYGQTNTMVLTFSSAITVKGAMGDVSRFRTDLLLKGYKLNNNYKLMNPDRLFLSTVNSSKGLERDYVIVILTFPLERAFINFSQDLTMNLITVGITRAKKGIIFYVPSYKDKFSQCLHYYKQCPTPSKESIREGKLLQEYEWSDYINMEHSVTELLRQSIVLYDTRLAIKEYAKAYNWGKLLETPIKVPNCTECEENLSFVGVLVENLITSSWLNHWPQLPDLEAIKSNPMYTHCIGRIYKQYEKYMKFTRRHKFDKKNQFEGIYIYTQVHIAVFNKLFMNIPFKENILTWWLSTREALTALKPTNRKLKVQENVKMPLVTGIADCLVRGDKENLCELWEIKASKDPAWKDNALSQVLLYALCLGRKRYRIHLLNPFRNEKVSMYFSTDKILTLRWLVYKDIITWNFNCWLSKTNKGRRPTLSVSNKTIQHNTPLQSITLHFLSPTKIHIKEFLWKQSKENNLSLIHRISQEHEESYTPTTQYDWSTKDLENIIPLVSQHNNSEQYNPVQKQKVSTKDNLAERVVSFSIDWNECLIDLLGRVKSLQETYKFS